MKSRSQNFIQKYKEPRIAHPMGKENEDGRRTTGYRDTRHAAAAPEPGPPVQGQANKPVKQNRVQERATHTHSGLIRARHDSSPPYARGHVPRPQWRLETADSTTPYGY